jgi:signal peptidase II
MLTECLWASAVILVMDQATKAFVLARAHRPQGSLAGHNWVRPIYQIGTVFGSFRNRRALLLLWIVVLVGISLLILRVEPFQEPAAYVGLGIAVGGATGNLLDIMRRGTIVDFIDIRIWPVFNIADAAIVLGVAVTLLSAG